MKTRVQYVRDVLKILEEKVGLRLVSANVLTPSRESMRRTSSSGLADLELISACNPLEELVGETIKATAEKVIEALDAEGWETTPAGPPYSWRAWVEKRILQDEPREVPTRVSAMKTRVERVREVFEAMEERGFYWRHESQEEGGLNLRPHIPDSSLVEAAGVIAEVEGSIVSRLAEAMPGCGTQVPEEVDADEWEAFFLRLLEQPEAEQPPPEKEFPPFCCPACGSTGDGHEIKIEADKTFGTWFCNCCGHRGTFTDVDDFPSVERYETAKKNGEKYLRQSKAAAKLSEGWSAFYQKYIEDLRASGLSVEEVGDCVIVGVPEDKVEKIRDFLERGGVRPPNWKPGDLVECRVKGKGRNQYLEPVAIDKVEAEARRRRTSPAFDRAVDPLGQIEKGKEPPVLFNGVRVGHVAAFKHVPGVKGLVADIVFDKDTPFEPWAGHTAGVELPESSGYPVRKVNLRTSIKATTSNEPPPEYVAAAFEARDRGQIQDATDHPAWSDFEYEIPGGLTAGRTIPELLKSRVFWWESWLKFRNGWNACRDKYRDDASHGN